MSNRRGHAGRVDVSQPEIVKQLRQMGASVTSLAEVGNGCPDLLVGWRGRTFLIECKTGSTPSDRKLTNDETEWHAKWAGDYVLTVSSPTEAVDSLLEATK